MFQFNNLEHELGLKAIIWSPSKNTFVSLVDDDFVYDNDCLVTAECSMLKGIKHMGGNISKHNMESCSCGIYATWRKGLLMEYQKMDYLRPILMIEASGKTILYDNGFRSEQASVRAVIDLGSMPIVHQAMEYFSVPKIDFSMALSAVDMWNWYLNAWYEPEDILLKEMGRARVVTMVAKYLGLNPMEALWRVAEPSQESS